MKITKFEHSCLLVEMPAPLSRTSLFDPGAMSQQALAAHSFTFLDDIIITHSHADHYDLSGIKMLRQQFPQVRITAPADVIADLKANGITGATDQPSDGIVFFAAPHESVEPLFPRPQQRGIHYLGQLSHPGDSHSFNETMPILALPVSGPWASTITAINLAIRLQPHYVIPIHDWHWNEDARQQMYANMEQALGKEAISFKALTTGEPIVINM